MTSTSEIYACKRLDAIEQYTEDWRQKEWEKKEEARRAREKEAQKKMYRLRYGIHRGTLMSRDCCEDYYFSTLEECKKRHMELKAHYNSIGYQIWYAEVVVPHNGGNIKLEDNPYY